MGLLHFGQRTPFVLCSLMCSVRSKFLPHFSQWYSYFDMIFALFSHRPPTRTFKTAPRVTLDGNQLQVRLVAQSSHSPPIDVATVPDPEQSSQTFLVLLKLFVARRAVQSKRLEYVLRKQLVTRQTVLQMQPGQLVLCKHVMARL